jgi:biopolymer transport protein ExbB
VALVVMCILMLMRDKVVPPRLVEIFEQHLNDKRYQEAYEVAKADQSVLGLILSAGLAKLSAGYPQALEAMQEVGDDESMKMEQKVGYVALIGSIAPMLGLLGTVVGMTDSFAKIAQSDQTPKPQELAQGINKALVTTVVGLWLAIPAIALFAWFKNRTQRLLLEAGMISEGLMSRFQSVSAKK